MACLHGKNRTLTYQRRSDKQKIAKAFHLGNVDGLALELAPDYNAALQSMQP